MAVRKPFNSPVRPNVATIFGEAEYVLYHDERGYYVLDRMLNLDNLTMRAARIDVARLAIAGPFAALDQAHDHYITHLPSRQPFAALGPPQP